MNPNRRRAAQALALPLLGLLPAFGRAQSNWPSKPIAYIAPFPVGGTTDILTRLIALKLGAALGTTVVVENRGGAAGSIGADDVAKAAPDGYTILGGTISSHAINAACIPKLGYDPLKSFTPVALIGTNATVLVVAASSPYKTLQDIIDAGKAKKPLASHRRATAHRSICRWSCSRAAPASTSRTCRIRAAARRSRT